MVPDLPDTLPEQMRALLPDDSTAVSADEAIAITAIRAMEHTFRTQATRDRFSLSRLSPAGLRRPAWAWLAVIAMLAIVLVLGFRALPSSKPSGVPVSKPSPPVTTVPGPTTTLPHRVISPTTFPRGGWTTRTITSTGTAQDIAPTSDGVYWLTYNSNPAARTPVTPFRYLPASARIIKGPSITGSVGSPAITVTGGWVWMVVGVGNDVVVEQLDISTLKLHSQKAFLVTDNPFGQLINPLLTATVNGPLWVAGGSDIWELNPTTGAIDTKFDSGDLITSMSTDPTGTLLYTGGWTNSEVDMFVTEYDAHTGQRLRQSLQDAVSPGTVAATDGGVWVTLRTGNYGRAFELSANQLSEIAPPSNAATTQGTYDQIGGVEASISEGTLWLISTNGNGTLSCADPVNGAVRAGESAQVEDPIARGRLLYGFERMDLVAVTPPASCVG